MSDQFILKGKEAVRESDLHKWGAWFETGDRVVAKTSLGESDVSTVFLGLDHGLDDGPPILFETLVFGGPAVRPVPRLPDMTTTHATLIADAKEPA